MDIKRGGSRSSSEGPKEWFTGRVRIEPLFQASAPGRVQGAGVTFEPGARSAWHTHPLGQTLIVTAGRGFVQRSGGPVEEIHPGDVVSSSPGEKHWHGATPDSALSHLAIQEELDGKVVSWMEKVSGDQYQQNARLQGRGHPVPETGLRDPSEEAMQVSKEIDGTQGERSTPTPWNLAGQRGCRLGFGVVICFSEFVIDLLQ